MLETKRLSIRPILASEADAYFDIAHDETLKEIGFYEPTRESAWRTLMVSSFQVICFEGLLGIEEKNSGELVGAIKIYRSTDDAPYEISFFVTKKHRLLRMMEETLKAIIYEMRGMNKNGTCILAFKCSTTNIQYIEFMKIIKLIVRGFKLPYSEGYKYSNNVCIEESLEIKV